MKYEMSNEQKLENYFKAVRMRLEGANKKSIIKNTAFPSWRVLEFFMTQNGLTLPLDKAAYNKQVDVTFFNNINSVDKTYILGFIYADGCIYDKGRFGFCICEDDIEILQFIKEKMKVVSDIKITHNKKGSINRRPQAVLRISSTKIVDILQSAFGIKQNKTLREGLIFPDFNSEELLLAFLRGVSDGDGNLYFVPGENNTRNKSKFRWTLCMTDYSFMISLQEYLYHKGMLLGFYEKQGKTCKFYILSTNSRAQTEQLCDLIYGGSGFYLKRKKEKYIQYKNLLDNTVLNIDSNESISV